MTQLRPDSTLCMTTRGSLPQFRAEPTPVRDLRPSPFQTLMSATRHHLRLTASQLWASTMGLDCQPQPTPISVQANMSHSRPSQIKLAQIRTPLDRILLLWTFLLPNIRLQGPINLPKSRSCLRELCQAPQASPGGRPPDADRRAHSLASAPGRQLPRP